MNHVLWPLVICNIIFCYSRNFRPKTETNLPKGVRVPKYIKPSNSRQLLAKKKVFVIIDIQNDFVNGSLSVFDGSTGLGNKYVEKVAAYMDSKAFNPEYAAVVYSIDYHPAGHCSFTSSYPDGAKFALKSYDRSQCTPKVTTLWPAHCQQSDPGADLHPLLPVVTSWKTHITYANGFDHLREKMGTYRQKQVGAANGRGTNIRWQNDHPIIWLFKGLNQGIDSYSAFLGNDIDQATGTGGTPTGLEKKLGNLGLGPDKAELHVVGIAYEMCVFSTIRDAVNLGYTVKFLSHLSASVLDAKGITIANNDGNPTKKGVNDVIMALPGNKVTIQ